MKKKICKKCSIEFEPQKGLKNYCSLKCRNSRNFTTDINRIKESKCIKCGKLIYINIRSENKCQCKDCQNLKICKCCGSHNRNCKRPDICKNYRRIKILIKYFGFNYAAIGTDDVYLEFDKIKTILYDHYWTDNYGLNDIAMKYKIKSFATVQQLFKMFSISFRNLSDAMKNVTLQKGIFVHSSTNYKHGWHTTWNNKKVFLRSSYEFDYATELDNLKIDYEVEKLRIPYWSTKLFEYKISIPDFYLPETNEIIEIKSKYFYNPEDINDRFDTYTKLGYKFKLILEHKEKILPDVSALSYTQ